VKVSVITPTFNSASTLSLTLQSVQSQTNADVEHIIQDGGSTDGTLEIVKRFPHVSACHVESDRGIYDAMNKGIQHSTGDIIAILNSDDVFYDENVLKDVVHKFTVDKSLDCIYGNISYFEDDPMIASNRLWISKTYYERFFEDGHVPPHPAVFVKKEVYSEYGVYLTDFEVAADYEFLFRVLKIGKINSAYMDRLMTKMRIGGASGKGIGNLVRNNQEVLRAWKIHGMRPPISFYIKRPWNKIKQVVN
jgi:glycosyltransferase